ncbi:MAG: cytochrome c-type biogenesis protein [Pseudomonadota bacterium]|nr:cytochrome c-type biogenesis protein [Pseudomonadota bacterium]
MTTRAIRAAGLLPWLLPALLTPRLWAVTPEELLSDPALEHRAREISQELRCVVCQNQTIDDSDAPLARDLRLLVRERLAAGDSDREVIDYVVERYGNFVLLKPPLQTNTLLLWVGPLACLAIGIAGYGVYLRTRRREEVAPLTLAEEARLAEILDLDRARVQPAPAREISQQTGADTRKTDP